MRAIKIYEYNKEMRLCGKRVIALGFFDGVHRGHRKILSEAVCEARKRGLPSAVFTFRSESEHIKGEGRIYPTEQKLSLIAECGIDEAIVADFDAVREVSAEDFITDILIDRLGLIAAVAGEDFRFGRGALGSTELLAKKLSRLGALLISPEDVTENGEKISSRRIKELLASGDIIGANLLLGAPYFVTGDVNRGLGLGKSFGFPTVNTELPPLAPPLKNGVYKTRCETKGKAFDALTNLGTCPTVGARKKHLETYILGCEGDLYGEDVKIYFLDFIRPEKKFDTTEQLIMQINIDINTAFDNKE